MGQDVAALVAWANAMIDAADPAASQAAVNPAVGLGLIIAAAARAGRDKMTLLVPPLLEPFGLWIEQLVAESTGKQGVGVVPVAGEPPAPSSSYEADRLFVRMTVAGAGIGDWQPPDGPVADLDLADPYALGAEFVRWEIATAVAGALLGINPFDEPNVQQAKDATRGLLDQYKAQRALPIPVPDAVVGGVGLTLSGSARSALGGLAADAFLTLLKPGDYFVLLAFLGPDVELLQALTGLRLGVRSRTRRATMFGYGPRYLHSTGQLHKGGPNSGVFVIVTAQPTTDVPIPGEPFSFGTLELAQALGDFASLDATGRRALHVHLPRPDAGLLRSTADALLDRLAAPPSA
jgi:transaldolase/glucose-6-phosphate isomerase